MTEITIETVDITPVFNYTREIEIVKRFIERVTELSDPQGDHLASELVSYIRNGALKPVRQAMSELMADDIKHQIDDRRFPIREQEPDFRRFHEYVDGGFENQHLCSGADGSCWQIAGALVHVL